MTKEEFILRKAEAEKRMKAVEIIPWWLWASVSAAMFGAIPLLLVLLCVAVFNHSREAVTVVVSELCTCLAVTAALEYQSRNYHRKAPKIFDELGLKCPACHKSLSLKRTADTGRCWSCGKPVFDGIDPDMPSPQIP